MVRPMITAPFLSLVEEAGAGVLVLVDGLDPQEFARSRLTRREVCRQLLVMAESLAGLPDSVRGAMPEVDWDAWARLPPRLDAQPVADAGEDAAWFAAASMVPATLSWLRVYRQHQPALFELRL